MIMNLEKNYTTQSFYLHVVVGTHQVGGGGGGEGGRYLTLILPTPLVSRGTSQNIIFFLLASQSSDFLGGNFLCNFFSQITPKTHKF
jgi:hypothetical protein